MAGASSIGATATGFACLHCSPDLSPFALDEERSAAMVRNPSFTAWYDAPPWAESSEPDDQAVIHSRRVGALIDLDGGELAVDVVRRDDLCLVAGIVGVVREPAWVRVAGVRVAPERAIHLARLLASAKEIAEPLDPVDEREGLERNVEVEKSGCSR